MKLSPRDLKAGVGSVHETHRTAVDEKIQALHVRLDTALQEALAHAPVVRERGQRASVVSTIVQIHSKWEQTKKAAIETGRLLMHLKRDCKDDYEALFDHNILPFGKSVECKLRKIAEAIEGGRVAEERLPIAYSAAYEIVTLDGTDLVEADARGLIKPETQRSEILEFKSVRRRERAEANPKDPVKVLHARRAQLERRRTALLLEMAEIDAELRQVNLDLNPGAEVEQPANFTREIAGTGPHAEVIDISTLRDSSQAEHSAADFTREIAEGDGDVLDLEPGSDFTREIVGEGERTETPAQARDETPNGDPAEAGNPDLISRVKSTEPAD